MIIYIEKEEKSKNYNLVCYRVYNNKKEKIATIEDLINNNEQIMKLNLLNREIEYLYFSLGSDRSRELKKELSAFEKPNAHFVLDSAMQKIGQITYKNNKLKGHLLISCYSMIFKYKNRTYEAWEVGFGKEGQYFVVFENDRLISIIENTYHENSDTWFKIFSEEDNQELIHLASYYFLDRIYSKRKNPQETAVLMTPYKEIKNKFYPDFIVQVKARDRVTE